MQHLDEGLIHAWLDGALSPEDAARVERHAATCAGCAALVADARGQIAGATRVVSSLDVVRGGVIPPKKAAPRPLWNRLHLTPARAALAASLLVAVSSLMVVRREPRVRPLLDSPAPAPAVRAAAPTSRDSNRTPRDTTVVAPAATASPTAAAIADRADTPPRRFSVDSMRAVDSSMREVNSMKARDANPASALPMSHRLSLAPQLQEVVTTGAMRAAGVAPARLARCYQLEPDSAFGMSIFPDRFFLSPGSKDTARVVHAVTAGGRIDTVLARAYWHQDSPTSATVFFSAPVSNQPATLTITAGATTAEASSAGQTRRLSLSQLDCRE